MLGNVKNVNYKRQIKYIFPKTSEDSVELGETLEIQDVIDKLEKLKLEYTHFELIDVDDRWGDFSHYSINPFKSVTETDEEYEERISITEKEELKRQKEIEKQEKERAKQKKINEHNLLKKLALELGYEVKLKDENS